MWKTKKDKEKIKFFKEENTPADKFHTGTSFMLEIGLWNEIIKQIKLELQKL